MGDGWVRRFEDSGMGSCEAGTIGVSLLGVGLGGLSGGCRIRFMSSFSKASL